MASSLSFRSFTRFTSVSRNTALRIFFGFERSAALFRNETFLGGSGSYKYKLFAREDGNFVVYLEDEKDPTRRFVSEPFALTVGGKPKGDEQEPVKLTALPPGEEVKGKAYGNA